LAVSFESFSDLVWVRHARFVFVFDGEGANAWKPMNERELRSADEAASIRQLTPSSMPSAFG